MKVQVSSSSEKWSCANGIFNLFPSPRAGMQAARANFTVKWPRTRPGNSLSGQILLLLCWSSGPFSWLFPAFCCMSPCCTSVDWTPTGCSFPWPSPANPGPFLTLFHSLIFPCPPWSSTGSHTCVWWDPYPVCHAVTHAPRTPFSCVCPSP